MGNPADGGMGVQERHPVYAHPICGQIGWALLRCLLRENAGRATPGRALDCQGGAGLWARRKGGNRKQGVAPVRRLWRPFHVQCKRCVRWLSRQALSGGRVARAAGSVETGQPGRECRSAGVSVGVGGLDCGGKGSAVADWVSVGQCPGPDVGGAGCRCAGGGRRRFGGGGRASTWPAGGCSAGCFALRGGGRSWAGPVASRTAVTRGFADLGEGDVVEGADDAKRVDERLGGVDCDLQGFTSGKC